METKDGGFPRNCPCCEREMTQGWIIGNGPFYWADKAHMSYSDPACIRLEERPRPFAQPGCYLTAWYCAACNLLLAHPPEQRERLTAEKMIQRGKEAAKRAVKKLRKIEP